MTTQKTIEKDRELLVKIKEKGDDDFEKNITYISAGTLVLSLTFIEKIVELKQSSHVWSLILSWGLLALTLLANLISHQLSSYYHEKTIEDVDNKLLTVPLSIKKRNRIIRVINWCTTGTLILGIFFLILFSSINAINMANSNDNLHRPDNGADLIKKGRTITVPVSATSNTSNSSNSSNQGTKSGQNAGNNNSSKDSSKK